ncbi:MAG: hypothetical protein J6S58_02645, partial [Lentisphaeria bacterium]|nr:hypothetical protein [Lentisphaeria bacterium]
KFDSFLCSQLKDLIVESRFQPVTYFNDYTTYNYAGGFRNRTFRYTRPPINTYVKTPPDLRRFDSKINDFALMYDYNHKQLTQGGKFPHKRSPNVLFWDLSVIHMVPNPNYQNPPPPFDWGWNDLFRGTHYKYD